MAERHDRRDRPAREESETDSEKGTDETDREEDGESRPQAQLRWVQLREPKRALEIGRNGRILDSNFHERYDSWEILLETYEGEV